MKFLIHLIAESEVGQHVQEIVCFGAERASPGGRRSDSPGGQEAAWGNPAENGRAASGGILRKLNVIARTVAEPEG